MTQRLEVTQDELRWFAAFHRLQGKASLSEIVEVRREMAARWPRRKTTIVLGGGKRISIRDRSGIEEFLAVLATELPDIPAADRTGTWPTL